MTDKIDYAFISAREGGQIYIGYAPETSLVLNPEGWKYQFDMLARGDVNHQDNFTLT